ncbi:MAG: replication and repair protein RecN, partial [Acidobacteriaceae bacterium]|nr:replication and repair protein RecN [Acidobacteriaceae bacterium]
MLLELRVENYAVIDNVTVEFAPGLNLLTGETGAGKSILIDALALLLGDKASTDMIRHGADKAVLSCVFEIEEGSAGKRVSQTLEENGIDLDSDQLILRREIAASGKGRVFVNNQPATVAVLKQLAPDLASIHAQNETVMAFDPAARLRLLDSYAAINTEALASAFATWRSIRNRITDLERDEQDRLRLVDLWSFQKKEIEAARLQPNEDEKLETEKRVLANSEKLYSSAMGAYETLYEGSVSATSLLRNAEKLVEELARYDSKFQESVALLLSARANIEDIGTSLRDYAEGINASPERLAEVEDRLALLDKLKRKYGQTIEEVITFGADAARKLDEVENREELLKQLNKELDAAKAEYLAQARAISKKRFDSAKKLEKLAEAEINELAMKARFKVDISGLDEETNWTASGFDTVAYLIATNVGEPQKPIEQIASGGELSRVMLALKASVEEGKSAPATNGKGTASKSKNKHQRTLVFDEIDTGIGGRAAEAVGKKLKSLARNNQVLCITHLPQIASFADQHYVIEKKESAGRVKTNIRPLTDTERTEEIARMLSGAKLTDTSLKHAEQMLKT